MAIFDPMMGNGNFQEWAVALKKIFSNRLFSFVVSLSCIAISVIYYLLAWSDGFPVVGGDHAAYLLMADHFSPFSDRNPNITDAVVRYIAFPPLYPLVLGLFGATSAHIVWAHVLTTSFFIAALAIYFVWTSGKISRWQGWFLTASFAFLPASLIQSLGLMSESLYLLLTLSALCLVSNARSTTHWYVIAVLTGLVVVTRTSGVALVAAFAIYIFIHRIHRRWFLLLISAVPLCLWVVFKWLMDYRGGYSVTIEQIIEGKSLVEFLYNQLVIEGHAIWAAWISGFDPFPSTITKIIGSICGILCVCGTVKRILEREMDGIYVAFYLLILLLWPFSIEAQRLLFGVLPILLYHGTWFVFQCETKIFPVRRNLLPALFITLLILLSFAATGVFLHRTALAQQPENRQYKAYVEWYQAPDIDAVKKKLMVFERLVHSWKKIPEYIAEDECVYHVDAAVLMIHANRVAHFPPLVDRDNFLKRATGCKYYYLGAYTRLPYRQLFYPADYIMDRAVVVFVEQLKDIEGEPILGILVKVDP